MIKELTQEQINLALNSKARIDKINGAQSIILQALNTMKNNSEANIIEAQDIYPELWVNLLSETIEVVDEMERTLSIKVKDIIKRTAISEKTNPIIKKSNRPVRDKNDNSLMTNYKFFNLSKEFDTFGFEEIIDGAIGKCLKRDINGVYESLDTKDQYIKEFLCGIDELTSSISDKSITYENAQKVLNEIEKKYNTFVAYDILFTIFEPDYTFALNLPIIKYGWINEQIQNQILEELKEKKESKDSKEESKDDKKEVTQESEDDKEDEESHEYYHESSFNHYSSDDVPIYVDR